MKPLSAAQVRLLRLAAHPMANAVVVWQRDVRTAEVLARRGLLRSWTTDRLYSCTVQGRALLGRLGP